MYIYLTFCKANNKKYIGQHKGNDKNYLGGGKLFQRALKKYGKEQFVQLILERADSKKELDELEKKWISFFDAVNSKEFYNIAPGGEGGNTWDLLSEERQNEIKLSASLRSKGKDNMRVLGKTYAFNLKTLEKEHLTIKEFEVSNYHVGIASKAIYITPRGNFGSIETITKYYPECHRECIQKKCEQNTKKVTKRFFNKKLCNIEDIGKTSEELGYAIIQIKDSEKVKQFMQDNHITK